MYPEKRRVLGPTESALISYKSLPHSYSLQNNLDFLCG